MHCEDAACLKVCPSSAIYKDPQTCITLVDKNRCLGCKACLWACPFGVPSYDQDGKLALCDLCLDRLQEGKKAACEAACQARAIFIGSPEEIKELRSKGAVKRMAESVGQLGIEDFKDLLALIQSNIDTGFKHLLRIIRHFFL